MKPLNYVGLALMAYGISGPVVAQFIELDQNPQWWMTVIASILGGLGLSVSGQNIMDWIKKIVSWKQNVVSLPTIDSDTNNLVNLTNIPKDKYTDLICLYYLSERFKLASDAEAVELCKKLQLRMYDIHHETIATPSGS